MPARSSSTGRPMPDYFTLFSFDVAGNAEELDWLEAQLARLAGANDCGQPCQTARCPDGTLWLYAEDYGEVDLVAAAIAAWQLRFGKKEPVGIEFASTCSKPAIGGFGGGAILVRRGQIKGINTGDWLWHERRRWNLAWVITTLAGWMTRLWPQKSREESASHFYVDDDGYVCFRTHAGLEGPGIFWTLHGGGWDAFVDGSAGDEPLYRTGAVTFPTSRDLEAAIVEYEALRERSR